jgi:UDP-N-acetylmuramoylalanine--D-glutamate ligase
MTEIILRRLRNKRILILGFGREGRSSLNFILRHFPEAVTGIADQKPIDPQEFRLSSKQQLNLHTGPSYLDCVSDYDIILRSPGINLNLLNGVRTEISSQTDLFLEAYAPRVIGITGTKGKSTTSALIHHLLTASGEHSLLTGNIGIPCFDIIPDIEDNTHIVFELSANQLQDVRHSPGIAVLLNIFEEHLDYFGSMQHYKAAKFNIVRFGKQDDVAIIHHSLADEVPELASGITYFPGSGLQLPDINSLSIRGEHNLLNIEAALLAVREAGADINDINARLASFRGLPHRLEYLGAHQGIHFFNDSIATIPEAAIAAMKALGRVDYLLLGGYDRGISYDILAEFLTVFPTKQIMLTGEAGMRIAGLLRQKGSSNLMFYKTLNEAVAYVKTNAQPNDCCLLSPAAASYDQYQNFEQRGDLFRKLICIE